ncbi:MAG: hypothetical protein JSU96_20980 [Acidobacteriota bacterium]|nr:MAG: hypothetical protein JSU96_20980 [Acidobacteriota bacterium]
MQEILDIYGEHGLKMVAINILPEQDESVPAWKASKGFSFPVLVGAETDSIIEDYHLIATPLSFLLDGEGGIIHRWDGYYPGAEVEIEKSVREALRLN